MTTWTEYLDGKLLMTGLADDNGKTPVKQTLVAFEALAVRVIPI